MMSQKRKKINPLPIQKKKCKKRLELKKRVKNTKFGSQRKELSSGNVPYIQNSSILKKDSMITLQHITNTSLYVVIESVARILGL